MDKREMIERALKPLDAFYGNGTSDENARLVDLDALAEQAIVIECRVEHKLTGDDEYTALQDSQGIFEATWLCWGHLGTPGKALAIIISLEEQD